MKENLTRKQNIINLSAIAGLTAFGIALFYIESFFPPIIPFMPYAKIGLSSIATMLAFVLLGFKSALFVFFARVVVSSIFGGNIFSLVFSLSGGLVSLLLFALLYTTCKKFLDIIVISVLCAISHNFVQLMVASLIVGNIYVLSLLPILAIVSSVAGVVTAVCVKFLEKKAGAIFREVDIGL